MNENRQWTFVVNDNAPVNSVRVHHALCKHARERVGDGWSGPFSTLEAAIIAARQLNRRDAKGCFWCLRELDDLTRPMSDLLNANPWR